MAWITLAAADLKTRLTGPEYTAMQTAALSGGQSDPLPEILAQITLEVRGRCAAGGNLLGAEGDIPDELKNAALNIARWEALTRFPALRNLQTAERKDAADEGRKLLEAVAAGKFRIVAPPTVDAAEDQPFVPVPSFFGRTKTDFAPTRPDSALASE